MAETIETFVARLRTEGLDAGKQEAEAIRAAAKEEAEEIVARARKDAEKIVADAKSEAAAALSRGRAELDLAVRDAVLRLRDAAARSIEAMLARAASQALESPAWISTTLREIVNLWAKSDHDGEVEINVTPQMKSQLTDWALKQARNGGEAPFNLRTTLKQAGFTYETNGGNVEVTTESVTETLRELVAPELQKLIEQAASKRP